MGKRFCVFALPLSEENITYAKKQTYSMVSPSYILIYTDKKRVKNGQRMNASELNARDQAWVQTCNDSIVANLIQSDAEYSEKMMRFLDTFAEELEKIKKKQERGEQNIGTDSGETDHHVRQDAPTV